MATGNGRREICEPYEYGNLRPVKLGLPRGWGLISYRVTIQLEIEKVLE